MKRIALFLGCVSLCASCLGLNVSSGPVVPGVWVNCFADARAYAERESIPMIVIYSDPECGFCKKLDTALSNKNFSEWQAEQGLVMVYNKGLGGEGAAIRNFARNKLMAYPYVALYWAKKDGTVVKDAFPGRVGYMPSKNGSTLFSQLTASVADFVGGWAPTNPGSSSAPIVKPAENVYVKRAFATTMPLFVAGREAAGPEGLLTLAGTSAGKVAAKYQLATRAMKDTFTMDKWTVDAAGTATISGKSRAGRGLTLTMTSDGVLKGSMQDGGVAGGRLTGMDIELANANFADFGGDYAVALPSAEVGGARMGAAGCAALTIKMSSLSAAKKGSAKVAVVYPDGKTASVAAQMITSGGRRLLPVAKTAAKNLVAVQLAFTRRPSASATNCVVSDETHGGGFSHDDAQSFGKRTPCSAYGSYLVASQVRSVDRSGWEFALDGADALSSERYGDLVSVTWPNKVSLAKTGLVKGNVALAFTQQKSVKGKFLCVYLPGWEKELGAKVLGPGWFADRQGGVSTVRMLTVGVK